MIKEIYTKPFQKSKSFLYPVLGLKNNIPYKPINTYLSIKDLIDIKQRVLICVFNNVDSDEFREFENNKLLCSSFFTKRIEIDDKVIYLFDLKNFKEDWDRFIKGKYSKLSKIIKECIKHYYGDKSLEYEYMDSYLNPEFYYTIYSELLGVSEEELQEIGELCSKLNEEDETLVLEDKHVELIKQQYTLTEN